MTTCPTPTPTTSRPTQIPPLLALPSPVLRDSSPHRYITAFDSFLDTVLIHLVWSSCCLKVLRMQMHRACTGDPKGGGADDDLERGRNYFLSLSVRTTPGFPPDFWVVNSTIQTNSSSLITFFILHGEILFFASLVARPGPKTVICGVM